MQYDEWSETVPNLKAVPGQVELFGVNILPQGTRAGHAERGKAINHISQMAELGYIEQDEANRRMQIAADATKCSELGHLISDLPGYTVHSNPFTKYDWDNPRHYVPTLLAALVASVFTAIVPVVTLATYKQLDHGWAVAVATVTITAGIIGFVASISAFAVKS